MCHEEFSISGGTSRRVGRRPRSARDRSWTTPAIAALKKEVIQLKVALADQSAGSRFFQRCLAKSRGSSPQQRKQWRSGIYDYITEVMPSLQGKLSVERMCMLAQVSRAGFYRWLREEAAACRRDCGPGSDSGDSRRAPSPVRIPAHHGRTSPSRHGGESQACFADDARRQSAGDSQTEVRLARPIHGIHLRYFSIWRSEWNSLRRTSCG